MGRKRFAELDFLRGLALVSMILWHLAWDLQMYYGYPFQYDQGLMYWSAKLVLPIFMLVAGISSSFTRSHQKRALRVLFFAMVITIVTYFYDREYVILFGILHFMGINMLLYPYYKGWSPGVLVGLGIVVMAMGNIFAGIDMPTNFLLPLGLKSFGYTSLDYYPLIPYSSYFIWGALLGPVLYKGRKPRFTFDIPPNPINFIGRNSLMVYVLHQPIILAGLNILSALGLLNSPI